MRTLITRVVQDCADQARSVVPRAVRDRLELASLPQALRFVHSPPNDADFAVLADFGSPWHRSLIFEELFALQVGMQLQRRSRHSGVGLVSPPAPDSVQAFLDSLPFRPTDAQSRVIAEVAADMQVAVPMNRLVHGDVGSGKTVVAFASALQAVAAGHQVAVMAPTELLAEQHHNTMMPWAEQAGVSIASLSAGYWCGAQPRGS